MFNISFFLVLTLLLDKSFTESLRSFERENVIFYNALSQVFVSLFLYNAKHPVYMYTFITFTNIIKYNMYREYYLLK